MSYRECQPGVRQQAESGVSRGHTLVIKQKSSQGASQGSYTDQQKEVGSMEQAKGQKPGMGSRQIKGKPGR